MTSEGKRREGDGGTYLVIADGSPEFQVAMNYAVHMATLRRGHVALARIIEPAVFTEWQGIESAAREEARTRAETELEALAGKVQLEYGFMPSLIIREGHKHDEIIAIARGNPALVAVVLGASLEKGHPGTLVQYFTAKGISQLAVPVIIVPGHLKDEDIRKLA